MAAQYCRSAAVPAEEVEMQLKGKVLVKCIAVPLLVGAVSGFLARGGVEKFSTLNKPPLSLPVWLFPIAWTILYVLMGVAEYLAVTSKAEPQHTAEAVTIYELQLFANFLWPVFFFVFEWGLFAFAWLILLWLLIAAAVVLFCNIKRAAGILMLPCLLWTTYAGYLNLSIYILNRNMRVV